MSRKDHHKVTKDTKAHEASMRAYFKYLVRNDSAAVLARFHHYDHAAEFASLSLARRASANTDRSKHTLTIEWLDDKRRTQIETLTLTRQRAEASG